LLLQAVVCNIFLGDMREKHHRWSEAMQGLTVCRGVGRTFLWVVLFVISACSMQQPDSRFGSSKSSESKQALSSTPQQPPREKEPVRVDYLSCLADIVNPEIYIYKQKRRLYVVQSGVMVRDYPIGLGSQPVGDKERDGDGRTPEGDFLVLRKDPASRFNKGLVLNYPDKKHAERALFAGIISSSEFKEIAAATEHKAALPSSTKLGGQLYIHAGGAHKDWTQGAIALYNSDMEELFKIASTGTPVHIRP